MWITTKFGAVDLKKIHALVVMGCSLRIFCGDREGDADIPFGTDVQANEAYSQLMIEICQNTKGLNAS